LRAEADAINIFLVEEDEAESEASELPFVNSILFLSRETSKNEIQEFRISINSKCVCNLLRLGIN